MISAFEESFSIFLNRSENILRVLRRLFDKGNRVVLSELDDEVDEEIVFDSFAIFSTFTTGVGASLDDGDETVLT